MTSPFCILTRVLLRNLSLDISFHLLHTQEQFKHISFSEIKENMNNINSLGKSLNVYPIPYRKMLKFLYS